MEPIYCRHCGVHIPPSATVCPECKTPRTMVAVATPSRGTLSGVAIVIAVMVVILAGGWWYASGTPSYALYELYRAANNHDGERAAGFVDFDGVTRKLIDEFAAEQASGGSPGSSGADKLSAMVAAGLMKGVVAGPMTAMLRSRFVDTIDHPPQDQPVVRFAILSEAVWNLHRDGTAASTHVRTKDGQSLDIAMARGGDGQWRISALGGPALHDFARDFIDRQLKQMNLPSAPPPSPSSP
jgi:Protein of unknown function (DUF2939)